MTRKEAIRNGVNWYTPEKPCPKCNTIALKHIRNGRCKGCSKVKEPFYKSLPDTFFITKYEAEQQGLSHYRNVKPCKNDHQSWRSVKTTACLECVRLKKLATLR